MFDGLEDLSDHGKSMIGLVVALTFLFFFFDAQKARNKKFGAKHYLLVLDTRHHQDGT